MIKQKSYLGRAPDAQIIHHMSKQDQDYYKSTEAAVLPPGKKSLDLNNFLYFPMKMLTSGNIIKCMSKKSIYILLLDTFKRLTV